MSTGENAESQQKSIVPVNETVFDPAPGGESRR
jgi:hypothetical protein